MKLLTMTGLLVSLVSLAGCASNEPKDTLQPAVLTQPSAATTKVLNATASRALNGTKVLLARHVLTQSSEMQIERMTQDPASMSGLNGRLMGIPKIYRFSLKKKASGDCYLVYQKTGFEYRLDGAQCRVL